MKFDRILAAVSAAVFTLSAVSLNVGAQTYIGADAQSASAPYSVSLPINDGISFESGEISAEEAARLDGILAAYKETEDDSDISFSYSAVNYFTNDYSDGYIYNQLTAREKTFYDDLYEVSYNTLFSSQSFSQDKVYHNLGSGAFGSVSISGMDFDRAYEIYKAFINENPQFFFLYGTGRYYGSNFYPYMYYEYADADKRASVVNTIADQMDKYYKYLVADINDIKKEENIYRIICDINSYDNDAYEKIKAGDYSTSPYDQTIAGVFLKNASVCNGYASAVQFMCNLADIDCVIVALPGVHAWNAIKLYDNWYILDTTWMDQETYFNYDYLNKSQSYVDSVDTQNAHIPQTYSTLKTPDCTLDDHEVSGETYGGGIAGIDLYSGRYVKNAPVIITATADEGYVLDRIDIYENGNLVQSSKSTKTVYTMGSSDVWLEVYFENLVPVDKEAVSGFVERFYTTMLGRASEEAGKADWINRLINGATATDVASGFVLSEELAQKNLSNTEFVSRMYRTFMNREPDAAGLADWTNALDSGCSYAFVLNSFVLSAEFGNICNNYGIRTGRYEITEPRDVSRNLTAFTSRMYTKALNREYEVNGLNYWTGRYINREISLNDMAYGFIFSEEFTNRNLSDEQYVDTLYATFFDRPADAGGKSDWLNRMHTEGYSREDVLNGFLGAEEFGNLVKSFGL